MQNTDFRCKVELMQDCVNNGESRHLIQWVVGLRINRSTRRTLQEVQATWEATPKRRWISNFSDEAFNMYCLMRRLACPRSVVADPSMDLQFPVVPMYRMAPARKRIVHTRPHRPGTSYVHITVLQEERVNYRFGPGGY